MNVQRLTATLKRHEGYRSHPYADTKGILTIGYGRNLQDVGVDEAEAEMMLANDIARATLLARKTFPSFVNLTDLRQEVLINMCFNLGGKIAQFKHLIAAIEARDWEQAALEMVDSKWYIEVGQRARELVRWMEVGDE